MFVGHRGYVAIASKADVDAIVRNDAKVAARYDALLQERFDAIAADYAASVPAHRCSHSGCCNDI